MKLSILIPSLVSRIEMRKQLFEILLNQIGEHPHMAEYGRYMTVDRYATKDLEIIVATDNKEMILGAKRNILLREARGEYVVFVDDDDLVSTKYIETLLTATKHKADCISFRANYYHNGSAPKPVHYSIAFEKDTDESARYCRIPNHLMCVRRELALQARFPEKNFGEDTEYAKRLKPLLKTETLIPEILYHYYFNSKTTETQGR